MPASITQERLRNQRLESPGFNKATDVVRWLVASQAQDFAGAKWALGLRMRGASDASIEEEFNQGEILRTHVLRPTWHFVLPEDIRWLLALTAPRVQASSAYRYRQLDLDAKTLLRTDAALARVLEGGQHRTREELREALRRARIAPDGQRMAHILAHAELEAVIASGPRRGKQFTYALLAERAPNARVLDREEALAELSRRYIASRGPASPHDFAKWSGLTLADARRGFAAIASTLRRDSHEHELYAPARRPPAARRTVPKAQLLSIYDEYISSYRDRSEMCRPEDAKRLISQGAALAYVLAIDGHIAGTWKRTFVKKTVRVAVTLFRPLTAPERRAVDVAAARFAEYLGGFELDLAWAANR